MNKKKDSRVQNFLYYREVHSY